MRLSNVCDDDLREVAKLRTRKGTFSSDAKKAQQILRTRNISMGFGVGKYSSFRTTLDANPARKYRTFVEENDGLTIEQYLEKEKERMRHKRKEK